MTETATAEVKTPASYWFRYSDGSSSWRTPGRRPPGEELAALRAGEGRDPFTVPKMWPYLSQIGDDRLSDPWRDHFDAPPVVIAEHNALVIFAIHQQAQPHPVHRKGARVGEALKRLHSKFSEEAVDRRFYAMITADSMTEMTHHLRGLVRQLCSLPGVVPLDYQRLYEDLVSWQDPRRRERVRRRWGRDYHAMRSNASDEDPTGEELDD